MSFLRGRLHGKFQPGLKFCPDHWAEILSRLYGGFQPGREIRSWAGKLVGKRYSLKNGAEVETVEDRRDVFLAI